MTGSGVLRATASHTREKHMITRIRIMHADKTVQVLDQTWSQLCETLAKVRQISDDNVCFFWDMRSVPLPDGGNVKLVKESV